MDNFLDILTLEGAGTVDKRSTFGLLLWWMVGCIKIESTRGSGRTREMPKKKFQREIFQMTAPTESLCTHGSDSIYAKGAHGLLCPRYSRLRSGDARKTRSINKNMKAIPKTDMPQFFEYRFQTSVSS